MRAAYEKLSAAQLIVASRATGTHVANRRTMTVRLDQPPDRGSFMEMYHELTAGPAIFQNGRARAGNISRKAVCQDPLTRRSRGIERSAASAEN